MHGNGRPRKVYKSRWYLTRQPWANLNCVCLLPLAEKDKGLHRPFHLLRTVHLDTAKSSGWLILDGNINALQTWSNMSLTSRIPRQPTSNRGPKGTAANHWETIGCFPTSCVFCHANIQHPTSNIRFCANHGTGNVTGFPRFESFRRHVSRSQLHGTTALFLCHIGFVARNSAGSHKSEIYRL